MRSPSAWQRAPCPQSFCLPCSINTMDSEAPSSQVVDQWKETWQKHSQTPTCIGRRVRGTPLSPQMSSPGTAAFPHWTSDQAGLCSLRERSQLGPLVTTHRLGTSPHCSSGRVMGPEASLSRGDRGQNPGGRGQGKPQDQGPEGCLEGAPEICRGPRAWGRCWSADSRGAEATCIPSKGHQAWPQRDSGGRGAPRGAPGHPVNVKGSLGRVSPILLLQQHSTARLAEGSHAV